MKPILWVLAGRMLEFDHIAHRMYSKYGGKEQSPYDIRYISDEQRIRGYKHCFYICEGTWFRRNDLNYIMEIMHVSGFKELMYSDLFGESRSSDSDDQRVFHNLKVKKEEFLTEEEMTI